VHSFILKWTQDPQSYIISGTSLTLGIIYSQNSGCQDQERWIRLHDV